MSELHPTEATPPSTPGAPPLSVASGSAEEPRSLPTVAAYLRLMTRQAFARRGEEPA